MQRPLSFRVGNDTVRFYPDSSIGLLSELFPKRRIILVTDQTIYRLHRSHFRPWHTIVLRAGEEYKVQATIDSLVERLIRMEADRQTLLVGVGGGVITDLTGYLASIYMRGVSFGFIPTTLLSMVDASIGGKNGIDVAPYKNMVGTIRQPDFILHDHRFLWTLPAREWSNGFAEIIKHAAIADAKMFVLLMRYDLKKIQTDHRLLKQLILRNVQFKFRIVRRDPTEKNDRKHLNFGHTLGHALEMQYELMHGEAISLGMVFAAHLSKEKYGFKDTDALCLLLEKYGLPRYARFSVDKVMRSMRLDKKRDAEKVDYILLKRIGTSQRQPLSFSEIEKQLRRLI